MKQLTLNCRHCWTDVVPVLSISGPHVKAECPNCSNYIKHLNSTERGIALASGMGVEGYEGASRHVHKPSGDRKVSKPKKQYKKTEHLPGVW